MILIELLKCYTTFNVPDLDSSRSIYPVKTTEYPDGFPTLLLDLRAMFHPSPSDDRCLRNKLVFNGFVNKSAGFSVPAMCSKSNIPSRYNCLA